MGYFKNSIVDNKEDYLEDLLQLQRKVDTLFDAIAHGDQKHRDWLKKAIENHFKGLPVEHE